LFCDGECGSIAAMILTTEALITDMPEKEKAPVPAEY
jgi:hypothetical protein